MRLLITVSLAIGSAWLSACASEPMQPTETSTLTPVPTATGTMVPPTETSTATLEPTAIPQEATNPEEISQDVENPEKLPGTTIEYFASQEFSDWAQEQDKLGKFPEVPSTAVPFDHLGLPTIPLDKRVSGADDGFHYRIVIPISVIKEGVYYQHPDSYPGIIAGAWRLDTNSEEDFGILFKYINPDKSHGFIRYIIPGSDLPLYTVLELMGYQGRSLALVGISFVDKEGCKNFYNLIPLKKNGKTAGDGLCDWYLAHRDQNTFMDNQFYSNLGKGLWKNILTDENGKQIFYIPTTPLTGEPINSSLSESNLKYYSR
jgi:hypothetical protein